MLLPNFIINISCIDINCIIFVYSFFTVDHSWFSRHLKNSWSLKFEYFLPLSHCQKFIWYVYAYLRQLSKPSNEAHRLTIPASRMIQYRRKVKQRVFVKITNPIHRLSFRLPIQDPAWCASLEWTSRTWRHAIELSRRQFVWFIDVPDTRWTVAATGIVARNRYSERFELKRIIAWSFRDRDATFGRIERSFSGQRITIYNGRAFSGRLTTPV